MSPVLMFMALQSQLDKSVLSRNATENIIVTADNSELYGAGAFEFEPDFKAFVVNPPEGGNGSSFTVRLWFNAAGKPVLCDASRTTLQEAAKVGCAQLMKLASFHLSPGMAAPLRKGFVDVEFSFFNNGDGRSSGRTAFVHELPGIRNASVAYPPDDKLDATKINRTDGKLSIPINADDYPPVAMRYSLESVSAVQLEVTREGAIRSCRPITGPGLRTAYLDNYSCALILKRGRFLFLDGIAPYTGLHYFNTRINWMLPK